MSADIIQLLQTKLWREKPNGWQSVWTFRTAQYCVTLEIKRRAVDPGCDLDSKQQGELEYFFARVAVYKNGKMVDYSMGGEAGVEAESPTVHHFYTHHFHPDPMVRNGSISRVTYNGEIDTHQPFVLLVREAIGEARMTMEEGRGPNWRTTGW